MDLSHVLLFAGPAVVLWLLYNGVRSFIPRAPGDSRRGRVNVYSPGEGVWQIVAAVVFAVLLAVVLI